MMVTHTKKPIVSVISGGTGGYMTLRGLSQYGNVYPISIMNVFDDGGSSGKLINEYGELPPGDLLRGFVALSKKPRFRELFSYRMKEGSLDPHTIGNIVMTAGFIKHKNNLEEFLEIFGDLLQIKGSVFPISPDRGTLIASLSDGREIIGESNIGKRAYDQSSIKNLRLDKDCFLYDDAHEALQKSSLIVMSPGDLYTSLLPNLLVRGTVETLQESQAKKVVILNLMTRDTETRNFQATDFLEEMKAYGFPFPCDATIIPSDVFPEHLVRRYYETERSVPVVCDEKDIASFTRRIIKAPLLSHDALLKNLIRHDSKKVAHAILECLLL